MSGLIPGSSKMLELTFQAALGSQDVFALQDIDSSALLMAFWPGRTRTKRRLLYIFACK